MPSGVCMAQHDAEAIWEDASWVDRLCDHDRQAGSGAGGNPVSIHRGRAYYRRSIVGLPAQHAEGARYSSCIRGRRYAAIVRPYRVSGWTVGRDQQRVGVSQPSLFNEALRPARTGELHRYCTLALRGDGDENQPGEPCPGGRTNQGIGLTVA